MVQFYEKSRKEYDFIKNGQVRTQILGQVGPVVRYSIPSDPVDRPVESPYSIPD